MTQPVQEPLTQRSISTLTWGQNQLFRRPGFVPEDELACDISLVYHDISAVGLNEHEIHGAPALLTGYYICNIGSAFAYVKLYDVVGDPVVGTDVPAITLGIPPLTAANIGFESFPEFFDGLGIGTTSDIADDGSSDVGFRQLAINIYYCDNPNPPSS